MKKIICILVFATFTQSIFAQLDWQTDTVFLETLPQSAIKFLPPNEYFVLGSYQGFLFNSADGGETWTKDSIGIPIANLFLGFDMFDKDYGWMSRVQNKIVATEDGGETWTEIPTTDFIASSNTVNIQFIDSLNVWVSNGQGIYKTSDGGVTFDSLYWKPGSIYRGYFSGDSIAHIPKDSFGDGCIVSTQNGGLSWTDTCIGSTLHAIDFSSDLIAYAVGKNGNINKTIDGGLTWQTSTPFTDETLYDIKFDGNNGVIVGENGSIFLTENGGEDWLYYHIPQFTGRLINAHITASKIIISGHQGFAVLSKSTTAVSNLEKASSFNVYPNPFHTDFKIDFKNNFPENASLKLFDTFGILVKTIEKEHLHNEMIDLSTLSNGVYFLILESNGRKEFVQIIKQ